MNDVLIRPPSFYAVFDDPCQIGHLSIALQNAPVRIKHLPNKRLVGVYLPDKPDSRELQRILTIFNAQGVRRLELV